jgi:hypothetical protein
LNSTVQIHEMAGRMDLTLMPATAQAGTALEVRADGPNIHTKIMKTANHEADSPTTVPVSASEIAEGLLGEIDWVSATEGYCECPGKAHHTGKDGHRDCILYLDRIPTIHCVHASCATALVEVNGQLRAAILNGLSGKPRKLTAEDKARLKERDNRNRVRLRAARSLDCMLVQYRWPLEQILADSPVAVRGDAREHWRLLLRKFRPADVIWIGDTYDSGKPENGRNFRPATEWLKEPGVPGPFVCPSAFKNSSIARSNDSIVERRFLVAESDILAKDEVGAVYKWLKDGAGLELVAIVDTGGKSLHAWFVYPEREEAVTDLKLVLPALKCDPKLFTPSQPVRLPGALRGDRFQRLVYLSQEVAHE